MNMDKRKTVIAIVLLVVISTVGVYSFFIPKDDIPIVPDISIPDYFRLDGPEPVTLDPHKVTDIGSHTYVGKIFSGLLTIDLIAADKNNDGDFVDAGEIIGPYSADEVQKVVDEKLPQGFAFLQDIKYRGKAARVLYALMPDIAAVIPEPVYNADGTISYVFKIRDGVKFRSGREVTAWDFAYSFDRAADPRTMSSTSELYMGEILGVIEMLRGTEYQGRLLVNRIYQSKSGEPFDISKEFVDLPGITVLDAKTLKITTKNVLSGIFYWHLTYPTTWVVNKVQVEGSPNSWTNSPDGTGPYWIESKSVGQITLRANQQHYRVPPKIDKVVYDIAGGSTLSSYENEEVDIAGVGLADIQTVRDPKSVFADEYYEATEMSTSYIGLNTKIAPFDDVMVRQAFAMAIDKEWLAHDVFADLLIPAQGVLPVGMPGYRPNLKGLSFDPARALQILSQSKYGGASGLPRIKITISSTGTVPSVMIQSIVQMWKDNLGVEVTIESIDYVTFLDQIKKGQFQMAAFGWIADYPDPEDFIDLKFHSQRSRANNEVGYASQIVDQLIEQARQEKDPQKRMKLYQQAEDVIIQEVPWIVLFHSKEAILVKPYVQNFFPTPMGISVMQYIYFGKK